MVNVGELYTCHVLVDEHAYHDLLLLAVQAVCNMVANPSNPVGNIQGLVVFTQRIVSVVGNFPLCRIVNALHTSSKNVLLF